MNDRLLYDLGPDVLAYSTRRVTGGAGMERGLPARDRAASRAGSPRSMPAPPVILPHQTHTTNIRRITTGHECLDDIDALTTDRRGIAIGVRTADCIPVLLYDPAHHTVAAIHAGWRGTVGRIVERTIAHMQAEYGTVPHDLRAVIGPGIGLDAFEVGDEVYDAFRAAAFPMERIAQRRDKWHIDLWEANRLQLLYKGVERIHVAGICTYTHSDEYFSARRMGIGCGRIITAIQTLARPT